jgi:hypothetical protein
VVKSNGKDEGKGSLKMEKRREIGKFRNRSACALRHSGMTGESESEDDDHVLKFTLAAYALEKAND